jgi:hypothetical protein
VVEVGEVKRPGYMMIKEAAVRYGGSRAKLHRLVQVGRLRTAKDPRDERITLLETEDVEALFRFPGEEVAEMRYGTGSTGGAAAGRLTAELAARMDAVRTRVARGRRFTDSVNIIREEREKRTRQIEQEADRQS